jgi:hypothetical protein
MLNLPDEPVNVSTIHTYIECRSKFLETEHVEKPPVKTLLCVEEKADVEGRIKEEVKIVKSITLLMTRIDA